MLTRKILLLLVGFFALSVGISAHAAIIFDDQARQDFASNRTAADSPLGAITVGAPALINQIGAMVDLNASGNLEFLILNSNTQSLLFNSGPVAFVDNGMSYKLSPVFSDFQLNPGITYFIGAIADVAGQWATNNTFPAIHLPRMGLRRVMI